MDRLFQIACSLSLLFLIYSSDVKNDVSQETEIPQQVYNIDALLKKTFINIRNTLQNEDGHPNFALDKGVNQDFLLETVERLNILENSTKCASDISYIVENLVLKKQWTLQMLDSWGKPESGFMIGNTKWLGDYTECINVYAPKNSTNGNFHGQYCSLTISSTANPMMSLNMGVCIPDSCTSSQLEGGTLQLFKTKHISGLSENQPSPSYKLQCQRRQRHLNGPAKGVIALLTVFCTLAILGSSLTVVKYLIEIIKETGRSTVIVNIPPNDLTGNLKDQQQNNVDSYNDLLLQRDTPSGKNLGFLHICEPLLECFCVFKNGGKLLNTKTAEGELLCIHGIRFLSMSWVILGHSYVFNIAQTRNILDILNSIKNWPFQIVLQAFYSVDSFFVLSGFLLTYLCMQEFNRKKGRINWPYFYLHRYLRLTPVYMVVLGFSATIYFYLGSGPFWPQNDIDPICQENWWWNLLYINNFNSEAKMCMAWSWYLANDMQFFVVSPIVLITLWRWPKVGYSILATLMCACWISNFYLTYHYDMPAGMAGFLTDLSLMVKSVIFFDKIYAKPYTRIAPYLVGMLTGYILFLRKRSNAAKHSWITLCIGWMIATTITLACTYGLYHQNPGLVGRSFYNTLSRTTWAVGLCWVIYVCLVDQGGFVNGILSYKFIIPLSRLTYVAYLIHPLIITGYYGSLKSTFEFSHPSVVIIYLGIMVVTYALSLPVALVFESPVIALEKLIRKKFSEQQ